MLRLGQMSYKLGLGAENCPRPYSAQNRRVPKMTLLLGGALLGTLHIYSIYVYIYIRLYTRQIRHLDPLHPLLMSALPVKGTS